MMRKETISGERIFVVHDFFTPEECDAHVAASERSGYDEAPITTARGPLMRKDVRDNMRVMVDDPELARDLFDRLRDLLPPRIGNWSLQGLNERFRYYRYEAGQTFRPHIDGSFQRSETERSFLTFMVYLNEGFTGGSTIFYGPAGEWNAEVVPRRGMALVFEHPQLHEGAPVEYGRKYVLRTDVMYAMAEPR
jgi:prolyl 4-hydroxylase